MSHDRVTWGVTSLSWIPSELLTGPVRVAFDVGLTHYDAPPPDRLDDLDALRRAGRFRFVNRVRAQATIRDGRVADVALLPGTGGVIGLTNLLGGSVRFPAVQAPDLRTVEVADDGSRAVVRQTAGGRAPLPAPRLVAGRPRLVPPLVWTTLEVELRADGTASHRVVGASPFPRHWVYGPDDVLAEKVATTDSDAWFHGQEPGADPWSGTEHAALTTPAETELERRLSTLVMGGRRRIVRLEPGAALLRQGDPGREVVLLLDGVVAVSRDGVELAQIGPGAVLGERALLEGARTATVIAVTPVTAALVDGDALPPGELEKLVEGHAREDAPG